MGGASEGLCWSLVLSEELQNSSNEKPMGGGCSELALQGAHKGKS